MKLLVLEDHADTAAYVGRGLTQAGHTVDVCRDGHDAFHLASDGGYDVLVLDRMVPGMDGLETVKSLRAAGVATPVLFLTALGSVVDRVEGLEAGADDYLVKPFAFAELMARVHALARRPPTPAEAKAVLRAGDLEMDRLTHTVTRAGKRLDLKPQEFRLLEYLLEHAGEIVTRRMLLENIWSFHFDLKTNLVESHMSRIRAKVDRSFDRELITTIRGLGYRVEVE